MRSRRLAACDGPHRSKRRRRMAMVIRSLRPVVDFSTLVLTLHAPSANAGITRIEIAERGPAFGGTTFGDTGPYELLRGRAYGELDPNDPRNRVIVDLQLAPRNDRGRVEYSTDVLILRPVDTTRANGRLVFELNNRGDMRAFTDVNSATVRALDRPDGAGN